MDMNKNWNSFLKKFGSKILNFVKLGFLTKVNPPFLGIIV